MTRLKFAVILNEENALDLHAAFTTHPQVEVLLDKSCVCPALLLLLPPLLILLPLRKSCCAGCRAAAKVP